jgi:DNA polymerase III subunit delta'
LFSKLVGQSGAIKLLTQAVKHQRLAPAYLFHGSEGIGKSLAARSWVEMIFTHNIADRSLISQKLERGNHPDLLWIEPTYNYQGKLLSAAEALAAGIKRRALPQIRIEQVREIGQFLSRPPLIADRSIAIINDADTMAEGAANALLKTLEEPGRATIILIASSLESLLPTLVSRCQLISFHRLDSQSLDRILRQIDRTELLENTEILGMAQGSVGKAIELWERLQTIDPELLERTKKFPTNLRQGLELAATIDRELDVPAQLWLLDYLQYHSWQTERDPDRVRLLETAKKHLQAYVQPRLIWECTFLTLI